MKETTITEGTIKKTFLFAGVFKSNYKVFTVECTDDEITEDKCLYDYEIFPNEKYSLYTASSYVGERCITDIEPGEIIEIESGIIAMRLA